MQMSPDLDLRFDLQEEFGRILQGPLRLMEVAEQEIFRIRFELYMADVLRPLQALYGQRPDFSNVVLKCLDIVARAYAERPADLRLLDMARATEPDWFQGTGMLGYVAYSDRFAGTLAGVAERIPYLKELGVTYLHLMPLLKPRPGANDGGYAVMDYRQVDPRLGTMDDLRSLATELRHNGISLCVDVVLNHTAKEHAWARQALAGDPYFQEYYLMYPDREMPDRYEETLPEIVELCDRYKATLMVDEAHAIGVLGERGAGACPAYHAIPVYRRAHRPDLQGTDHYDHLCDDCSPACRTDAGSGTRLPSTRPASQ